MIPAQNEKPHKGVLLQAGWLHLSSPEVSCGCSRSPCGMWSERNNVGRPNCRHNRHGWRSDLWQNRNCSFQTGTASWGVAWDGIGARSGGTRRPSGEGSHRTVRAPPRTSPTVYGNGARAEDARLEAGADPRSSVSAWRRLTRLLPLACAQERKAAEVQAEATRLMPPPRLPGAASAPAVEMVPTADGPPKCPVPSWAGAGGVHAIWARCVHL